MLKVLFVASSSFSGSTLLSFLLNEHPEIATVGHTIGWRYAPGEEFFCSCGENLERCPFWKHVADGFRRAGLAFSFNDFGTRYELSGNERLNRYLLAQLPLFDSGFLEGLRDAAVRRIPGWSAKLRRQHRANLTLIRSAMDYGGARLYVDNTHSPFRLRMLARNRELDIMPVHLIRDPRGTIYSYTKNHGWTVQAATRIWFREQANIIRILREFDRALTVRYEDLCDDTESTLSRIHGAAGLSEHRVGESFGQKEHHILGNVMRFGEKTISQNRAWTTALSRSDQDFIAGRAADFMARRPGHPLSESLRDYLEPESGAT